MKEDFPIFKECISFERVNACHFTEPRHFSVLSMRLSGEAIFCQDKREITVKQGELLFLPCGIGYSQRSERESVISVHFYGKINTKKIVVFRPQNAELVKQQFILLAKICEEMENGYEYNAMSAFYKLLYLLKNETVKESRIEKSLCCMRQNYLSSGITVGEIAQKSDMSEVRFRKLFRNQFGTSPIKYLNALRVEYACRLLEGKYFSVEETAKKSGFESSKYFSKVFKDITGVSPGKYAANDK